MYNRCSHPHINSGWFFVSELTFFKCQLRYWLKSMNEISHAVRTILVMNENKNTTSDKPKRNGLPYLPIRHRGYLSCFAKNFYKKTLYSPVHRGCTVFLDKSLIFLKLQLSLYLFLVFRLDFLQGFWLFQKLKSRKCQDLGTK